MVPMKSRPLTPVFFSWRFTKNLIFIEQIRDLCLVQEGINTSIAQSLLKCFNKNSKNLSIVWMFVEILAVTY